MSNAVLMCAICGNRVYFLEKHTVGDKTYHRSCYRGTQIRNLDVRNRTLERPRPTSSISQGSRSPPSKEMSPEPPPRSRVVSQDVDNLNQQKVPASKSTAQPCPVAPAALSQSPDHSPSRLLSARHRPDSLSVNSLELSSSLRQSKRRAPPPPESTGVSAAPSLQSSKIELTNYPEDLNPFGTEESPKSHTANPTIRFPQKKSADSLKPKKEEPTRNVDLEYRAKNPFDELIAESNSASSSPSMGRHQTKKSKAPAPPPVTTSGNKVAELRRSFLADQTPPDSQAPKRPSLVDPPDANATKSAASTSPERSKGAISSLQNSKRPVNETSFAARNSTNSQEVTKISPQDSNSDKSSPPLSKPTSPASVQRTLPELKSPEHFTGFPIVPVPNSVSADSLSGKSSPQKSSDANQGKRASLISKSPSPPSVRISSSHDARENERKSSTSALKNGEKSPSPVNDRTSDSHKDTVVARPKLGPTVPIRFPSISARVEELEASSQAGMTLRGKGPAPPRPLPAKREVRTEARDEFIPYTQIQEELEGLNAKQTEIELRGREMQEALWKANEMEGDFEQLLIQWLRLVEEKNVLFCRESELHTRLKQQELEDRHADLEYELRLLMIKQESQKIPEEKAREEELITLLLQTVEQRAQLVEEEDEEQTRTMEVDQERQNILEIKFRKMLCMGNKNTRASSAKSSTTEPEKKQKSSKEKKSAKEKSTKEKPTKEKSTKEKPTKEKSTKEKSTKEKSTKEKSTMEKKSAEITTE